MQWHVPCARMRRCYQPTTRLSSCSTHKPSSSVHPNAPRAQHRPAPLAVGSGPDTAASPRRGAVPLPPQQPAPPCAPRRWPSIPPCTWPPGKGRAESSCRERKGIQYASMRPRPRHQVKAWQAGSCHVDSCAGGKPTERHMLQVKHPASPSGAPAARCQRRSTGQRRRPERRPWRRRHSGRDPGAPALAPMTPRLSAGAVEQGNGSQSAAMACDKIVLAGGRPFHPLRTSCCSVACSISLDRRDSSATSAAGGRKPPSRPIAAAGCRPFLQMNRRRDPARSIRAGALPRALDELPTCAVAAARRRHVGQRSRLHYKCCSPVPPQIYYMGTSTREDSNV